MSKTINKKLAVAIALIAAVFMFTSVQSAYAADTVGKLDKPVIKLSLSASKAFTVTTRKDVDATGYQIKYAKNSSFTSAKTVNVKGNKLSKKISKLTAGKKYYVKVRAYKTVDGKKTYGSWSSKKYITPKTYYYAYLNKTEARIYTEQTSSSSYVTIYYNTKLKIVSKKTTTSGTWSKVKYDGKTYYLWEEAGSSKLMPVQNTFDDYSVADNSPAQNAVIDKAIYILKNWKTEYKKNAYNDIVDGKHIFDCSGFATYVYNETLAENYPGYFLPHKTTELYDVTSTGVSNIETVCTSLDYKSMKPGDLILFKTKGGASGVVNHCGIYLGGKEFIHCNDWGVNVLSLEGSYADFVKKVIRVIPE